MVTQRHSIYLSKLIIAGSPGSETIHGHNFVHVMYYDVYIQGSALKRCTPNHPCQVKNRIAHQAHQFSPCVFYLFLAVIPRDLIGHHPLLHLFYFYLDWALDIAAVRYEAEIYPINIPQETTKLLTVLSNILLRLAHLPFHPLHHGSLQILDCTVLSQMHT